MPDLKNVNIGRESVIDDGSSEVKSVDVSFTLVYYRFRPGEGYDVDMAMESLNFFRLLRRTSPWFWWLYNEDPSEILIDHSYDLYEQSLLVRVEGVCHDTKQATFLKLQDQP